MTVGLVGIESGLCLKGEEAVSFPWSSDGLNFSFDASSKELWLGLFRVL
jgi:hypothetical protein